MEGESYIKDMIDTPRAYLIPPDIKEIVSSFVIPDVLTVYGGDEYQKVKRILDGIITHSEDDEMLQNTIKECQQVRF